MWLVALKLLQEDFLPLQCWHCVKPERRGRWRESRGICTKQCHTETLVWIFWSLFFVNFPSVWIGSWETCLVGVTTNNSELMCRFQMKSKQTNEQTKKLYEMYYNWSCAFYKHIKINFLYFSQKINKFWKIAIFIFSSNLISCILAVMLYICQFLLIWTRSK